MARRVTNHGSDWTASEMAKLKLLAKQGTAKAAAKNLGRTPEAVQQKAMRSGVSFRGGRRAAAKRLKAR